MKTNRGTIIRTILLSQTIGLIFVIFSELGISNLNSYYQDRSDDTKERIAELESNFIIPQAFASKEKDKDYDGDGVTKYYTWEGRTLGENEYLQRVLHCNDMRFSENPPLIDLNTNCREWVLTYEGEYKLVNYILEKNDIDTSEEKLDFWLDQLDK